MATKAEKVKEIAASLGKSERAVWYWIHEGCNIENPESVRQFSERKERKRTNVQKSREKLKWAFETAETLNRLAKDGLQGSPGRFPSIGDKDLPPLGRRGAAAALQRLEE